MWLRRVFAGYKGSTRPSLTNINSFSSKSAPNTQPATPQRIESHDHEQPPALYPSTTVNYSPWRDMPHKKKKSRASRPGQKPADAKMGPPVIHIPGLTLINNMAPHAWPTAPPTGPRKVRFGATQLPHHHQPNNTNPSNPNGPQTATPGRDARQLPSKESGGVPDPTPLYLAQSLAPPILLRDPRRILVIMDLNGTLLYRPNKKNPFNFIERPHARRFLSYCIDTFHVAIWSSARPENVLKMVAQLLSPDQRSKCVVTWARDKFGLCTADYDSRVQCYKRLTTIWADPKVIASHPAAARGQTWDQTNTVLVDDSMEKGRSEPHNLLQIPEFSGLQGEHRDVLPQVHDYLNSLCYQADVSRYMRQTPFRLDVNYKLPPPPAE